MEKKQERHAHANGKAASFWSGGALWGHVAALDEIV